jgi:hypothetical protein
MGTHKGEAVSILDCFLAVFELIIPVKIISWMRDSNSHLLEWKFLLSPWIQAAAPTPHSKLWVLQFFRKYSTNLVDYSFFGCSQGIQNLEIPGTMTSCPSVKFSWMDLYCEFYDKWQGLEVRQIHLVVVIIYRWLWAVCNWGLAIIFLINKCTNSVRLQS